MTGNTQYSFAKGSKEEIIRRSEEDVGVLYILGDLKFAAAGLSRRFPVYPWYRNMPGNQFFAAFLDYTKKKQHSTSLDSKQANQLCRVMDIPIAVNYKVYHTMRWELLHESDDASTLLGGVTPPGAAVFDAGAVHLRCGVIHTRHSADETGRGGYHRGSYQQPDVRQKIRQHQAGIPARCSFALSAHF